MGHVRLQSPAGDGQTGGAKSSLGWRSDFHGVITSRNDATRPPVAIAGLDIDPGATPTHSGFELSSRGSKGRPAGSFDSSSGSRGSASTGTLGWRRGGTSTSGLDPLATAFATTGVSALHATLVAIGWDMSHSRASGAMCSSILLPNGAGHLYSLSMAQGTLLLKSEGRSSLSRRCFCSSMLLAAAGFDPSGRRFEGIVL